MKIKKAIKIIKQWEKDNPLLQLSFDVPSPEYKKAKKVIKKFAKNIR
jgi:hypothetical protein